MSEKTDKTPSSLAPMTELFDILTERGVLSGLYLAALAIPLIIAESQGSDIYVIAAVCTILGLILSKITYEFLLDYIRPLTESVTLNGFNKTVKPTEICSTYGEFRKIREKILGSDLTSGQQY